MFRVTEKSICTIIFLLVLLQVCSVVGAKAAAFADRTKIDYLDLWANNPALNKISETQRLFIASMLENPTPQSSTSTSHFKMPQLFKNAITHRLASDTSYTWQTDHWKADSRATYSYSGVDTFPMNLLSEMWVDDSAKWLNNYQLDYAYNSDHKLITSAFQVWAGGMWVNITRSTRSYGLDGNLATTLTENWDGSTWNPTSLATYSYNFDRVQQILTQAWQSSSWANVNLATFEYDASGNQTLLRYQLWQATLWVNSFQTISTYIGGNQTESINQLWNGATWINQDKVSHTYDPSGNPIIDITSAWNGSSWTPTDADTMKYNAKTKLIQNVHLLIESGLLVRIDYMYDLDGNLIEDLSAANEGSGWFNTYRAAYVYDSFSPYLCGDADADSQVNIADAVFVINYIFVSGPAPDPLASFDVDCSGSVNVADIVYLINYIFASGQVPCATCQ